MSRPGPATWPVPTAHDGVFQAAVLTLAVAGVAAAAVLADGNVLVVVAPLVAVVGLWMITVAPLRKTLLMVSFVSMAIDKPGDAEGLWQSPVAPLGGLLLENLNKTVNIDALKVSLLVMLLVYLAAVRVWRLSSRVENPELTSLTPAPALHLALVASTAATVWLCVYGIAMGGDPQMSKIQVQTFLSVLLMAYLLSVSLRGPVDYRALATLIVVAACIKAGVAVWVRHLLPPFVGYPPREVEYTTTHGDSLLFATAVAVVVATFFERPVRRNGWVLLCTLPILVAGMVANNRRLAWLQVMVGGIVMLAVNPHGRSTRRVVRTLVYAAPLLAVYTAVGWNSGSKIFAPVQMIQSVGDSDTNRSTLYRDAENYDLIHTFRRNPLLGSGFGHPFDQAVALDDISKGFKEWRYLPHNSILGLWAFGGALGFTGLWIAAVVGLWLAARSYPRSRTPDERAAALTVMVVIVAYMLHCWGDIGFSEQKGIFLVGGALAVAGQLAASTGAWSSIRTVRWSRP